MKILVFLSVTLIGFASFNYLKNTNTDYKSLESNTILAAAVTESVHLHKILLVPGHDSNEGGGSYKGVFERDLAVDIANRVAENLASDPTFNVIISRNKESWNPIFTKYFNENEEEIITFKNQKQQAYKKLILSGVRKFVPDMANHTEIDKKAAVRLYGTNKWANENDIEAIIHIHFNDSARKNRDYPGINTGLTIFIPESQLPNASTSRKLATSIYNELIQFLKPEKIGNSKDSLIEDQSLIALGASETLEKPSILVEYAYIYEVFLRKEIERDESIKKMADLTTAGIKKFYEKIPN